MPKSVNPVRQRQNIDLFGFELSKEEMDKLDSLEQGFVTGGCQTTA